MTTLRTLYADGTRGRTGRSSTSPGGQFSSDRTVVDTPNASKRSVHDQVEFALAWLRRHSTRATREGMARYAIPSHHAYGVAMKDIKALGTMLGRNQPLAVALWATGVYEALRAIGKRNRALNSSAVIVARRLADSKDAAARWVGKDALRELTSPAVTRRLKP